MNNVVLIGRLTRDPEMRYTTGANQMAVTTFTLAIDRPVKQGQEKQTDFIRITAFGRMAENCDRYLAKGRRAAVQGRIQTGSYTNKDGQRIYTTDVIVDEQEFADAKRDGAESSHYGTPSPAGDGFMNIPDGVEDEGLPFN